jgi:hypothetical protein
VHSKNFPIFWVGQKKQRNLLKNITGYTALHWQTKIGNKKANLPISMIL